MSYILDALKKSAAERARGLTPSLHTHTMGQAPDILVAAKHAKVAFYGVMGLALLLLGAIFWLLLNHPLPVLAPTASATLAPAVLVPSLPKPALVQAAAPTTPQSVPATALVPNTNDSIEKPPAKTSVVAKPKQPRVNVVPDSGAAVTTTEAPSTNEPHIYAISELPDDIKASLPKLAISGAVYANTPASRMLIVSGQIYRESDEPAPGLQVEQIRPKEAIFKYQGYRYRQSYP